MPAMGLRRNLEIDFLARELTPYDITDLDADAIEPQPGRQGVEPRRIETAIDQRA